MSIGERPEILLGCPAPVRVSAVVAIPVCNERDRIIACLDALSGQVGVLPGTLGLLLFLNNCTDGTRELVEAWMQRSPVPIRVVEQDFASASAGWARGRAMDAAAAWLESAGASQDATLLTTDADSRVRVDWVRRNLLALAGGADAVAGRIVFDAGELTRLPSALRARQRLEAAYETLLAEIEARLDPQPGNPWPSHWTRSGATIALRLSAFRRIGGVPRLESGEDHALIDAVKAHGLVVRHDPDVAVVTSSRLVGRARDGVADTLRLRDEVPDVACDPRLERLDRAVLRMLRCRHCRLFAQELTRPAPPYRPLRPSELPLQIRRARALLGEIRQTPRTTSSLYASVREPPMLVDQLRAARKKWSAAWSPVKG